MEDKDNFLIIGSVAIITLCIGAIAGYLIANVNDGVCIPPNTESAEIKGEL